MIKYTLYLLLVILACSCNQNHESMRVDRAKVALRSVGHQLLLQQQDSSSLVLPVKQIDNNKFEISFQNTLKIYPDSLVDLFSKSTQKSDLPKHYLVEVLRCEDTQVAYSYEMKATVEKGIIPCRERQLPLSCYHIHVQFFESQSTNEQHSMWYYLFGAILSVFVLLLVKRLKKSEIKTEERNFETLGRFKFYPEQNKLIKEATEISLSRKECELLAIFAASPNQIIKREALTKQVWEDNGVVVGRSLDTYISKLRQKLKEDTSIKLTNVHGVGYKLEINLSVS